MVTKYVSYHKHLNDIKLIEWKNNKGQLHNENNEPAWISYENLSFKKHMKWYINGQLQKEAQYSHDYIEWEKQYKNNHLYEEIIYDIIGKIKCRKLYQNNNLFRIASYNFDKVKSIAFYDDKKYLHNATAPALITFHYNGVPHSHTWYRHGVKYRDDDLPNYVVYDSVGRIRTNIWMFNNKHHRVNGPAHILYYVNKNILSESWSLFGKNHRVNGPAYVQYHVNGDIINKKWSLFGKKKKDQTEIINTYLNYLTNIIPCITENGVLRLIITFL